MKIEKLFLFFSIGWLIILFLFNPHFISSGTVLEAWAIKEGVVLYKEIASFHFPLGRLVSLLLYEINGWNMETTPYLGLLVGMINLGIIYRFGKKYLNPIGTIFALLFFSFFYWFFATGIMFYHEQLIGMFLSISIYLLMEIITKPKIKLFTSLYLGLFLSLSEISGQVASIVVATISIIFFIYVIKKGQNKFILITRFLFGLFIPLVPLIIYFSFKGALWDFIYWNTIYYFDYSGETGSLLDLPFLFVSLLYIPAILLFLQKLLAKKKNGGTNPILIISISTIPFAILSVFHYHHLSFALPILAISLGYFASEKFISKLIIFTSSAILLLIFLKTTYWHYEKIVFPPDLSIRNDISGNDPTVKIVVWLKNNTNENETIFVVGNSMVYVKANRKPSSRPSHSIPYSWVPFDKVKMELLAKKPDYFLIESNAFVRIIRDYHKPEMDAFIKEEISKCFTPVVTIDSWDIFKNHCL